MKAKRKSRHELMPTQTDWNRIRKMRDEDVDLSEIPGITAKQMARSVLRVGGKPAPQNKVQVNLDGIASFKNQ